MVSGCRGAEVDLGCWRSWVVVGCRGSGVVLGCRGAGVLEGPYCPSLRGVQGWWAQAVP